HVPAHQALAVDLLRQILAADHLQPVLALLALFVAHLQELVPEVGCGELLSPIIRHGVTSFREPKLTHQPPMIHQDARAFAASGLVSRCASSLWRTARNRGSSCVSSGLCGR